MQTSAWGNKKYYSYYLGSTQARGKSHPTRYESNSLVKAQMQNELRFKMMKELEEQMKKFGNDSETEKDKEETPFQF